MEISEFVKNSATLTNLSYHAQNNNTKTVLSLNGARIKQLLKAGVELGSSDSCREYLTKQNVETIADSCTAADFFDMPVLLTAALSVLAGKIESFECCVDYNAHPKKIDALLKQLTPPVQELLRENLSWQRLMTRETLSAIACTELLAITPQPGGIIVWGKKGSFVQKEGIALFPKTSFEEIASLEEKSANTQVVPNPNFTQYASTERIYIPQHVSFIPFEGYEERRLKKVAFFDTKKIVGGAGHDLCIWDSATGKRIAQTEISGFDNGSVLECLAAHPQKALCALSVVTGKKVGWYTFPGSQIKNIGFIDGFQKAVSALAFDNKDILAVGCYDSLLYLVSCEKNQIITTIDGFSSVIREICFTPENTLCAIASHEQGTLHCIHLRTPELKQYIALIIGKKLPHSAIRTEIHDIITAN